MEEGFVYRIGDGQNVVNSVSIGIRLLNDMFSIPYRRCLLEG